MEAAEREPRAALRGGAASGGCRGPQRNSAGPSGARPPPGQGKGGQRGGKEAGRKGGAVLPAHKGGRWRPLPRTQRDGARLCSGRGRARSTPGAAVRRPPPRPPRRPVPRSPSAERRPGLAGTRSPPSAPPSTGPRPPTCRPRQAPRRGGRAARREAESQRRRGPAPQPGGTRPPRRGGCPRDAGKRSARDATAQRPRGRRRFIPGSGGPRAGPPRPHPSIAPRSAAGGRPRAASPRRDRRDERQPGREIKGALRLFRRSPRSPAPLSRAGAVRRSAGRPSFPARAVLTPTAQRPRSSAAMSSTAPHVGINPGLSRERGAEPHLRRHGHQRPHGAHARKLAANGTVRTAQASRPAALHVGRPESGAAAGRPERTGRGGDGSFAGPSLRPAGLCRPLGYRAAERWAGSLAAPPPNSTPILNQQGDGGGGS